jgi:LCP family protein required for cell wall assembly
MDYGFFDDWGETREWGSGLAVAKRAKKRKRRSVFSLLAKVLFFTVLFTGCLMLGYYLSGGTLDLLKEGVYPPEAAASHGEKVFPVLLLGVDQRQPNEPSRADTIIVAFLDREKKEVRLLSIPRDTYTWVPGYSHKTKINVSHALEGPEGTMVAVSELLGIKIRYYVETNFEGFKKIVDTLGGVTINVERRMYYPAEGINLYPGVQRLNGEDALAYVRFRGYPRGDIDRIEHQQRFFRALADEAVQWRNIWKIPDLVRAVEDAVNTNLSVSQMIELGNAFRNINSSQLEAYTLPGDPQMIDGVSYWVPREEEIPPLVELLIKGEGPESASEDALPGSSDVLE